MNAFKQQNLSTSSIGSNRATVERQVITTAVQSYLARLVCIQSLPPLPLTAPVFFECTVATHANRKDLINTMSDAKSDERDRTPERGEAKAAGGGDEQSDRTPERGEAKSASGGQDELSPAKPEQGERPPPGKLLGYTQTYLVWKDKDGSAPSQARDGDGKDATEDLCEHEVLFRCGNWCYTGHVVLNREIALSDTPLAIPLLQRQQSRLHYYCNADAIPAQSNFAKPMRLVYSAADYAHSALSADAVQAELGVWATVHDWMEDTANTFFGKLVRVISFCGRVLKGSLPCSAQYSSFCTG